MFACDACTALVDMIAAIACHFSHTATCDVSICRPAAVFVGMRPASTVNAHAALCVSLGHNIAGLVVVLHLALPHGLA